MNAYLYQAALYCEACTHYTFKHTLHEGQVDTGDSSDYPQGPFMFGGGEADSPSHCDTCGIFLQNPLTEDGEEYVRCAIRENRRWGQGSSTSLDDWFLFYAYLFPSDAV